MPVDGAGRPTHVEGGAAGPAPGTATAEEPGVVGGQSQRLLRGGSWLAAGQIVRNVLQFVVIIVLAKVLTPEDYGLATLAFVVLAFGFVFTELGLTAAVVQKQDLDESDLRAAFWINAGAGLLVTLLVAASAPLVAGLYDEPDLLPLLLLASLMFSVSLGVVHTALLERSGRFQALTVIELVSTVFGWSVTITAAVLGAGPLSLILGPLLQSVLGTVVLWSTVRWLPRGLGDRASYRHVWRFGRSLSAYNLVHFVSYNTDSIVVSRISGAADLGLYNRAYNLTRMPADQAFWILDRLLLPTFSRLQSDVARLQSAVIRSIGFTCLVMFPALFGMAVVAEPLVVGVLGAKWVGMVPLLQLLALASAPQVAASVMRTVFTAAGQTQALFRYGLAQNALTVACILVGARWGVTGVAAGLALRAWLGLPWFFVTPMRLLNSSWKAVMPPILRVLAPTAVMSLAVGGTVLQLDAAPPLVQLLAGVVVGVPTYAVAALVLARPQVDSALALVRDRKAVTA